MARTYRSAGYSQAGRKSSYEQKKYRHTISPVRRTFNKNMSCEKLNEMIDKTSSDIQKLNKQLVSSLELTGDDELKTKKQLGSFGRSQRLIAKLSELKESALEAGERADKIRAEISSAEREKSINEKIISVLRDNVRASVTAITDEEKNIPSSEKKITYLNEFKDRVDQNELQIGLLTADNRKLDGIIKEKKKQLKELDEGRAL